MNAPVCPYLGLKEDRNTTLNFPSDGNCCYHVLPVVPVKRDHQSNCCLTPNHGNCPVFQMSEITAMPEELASPAYQQQRQSRGVLIALVVALTLLGVLGLSSLLRGRAAQATVPSAGTQNPGINLTPTGGAAGLGFPLLFGATNTPTETLPPPQDTTITSTPQPRTCTTPTGWIEYAVKPTDSTFRLSVMFRVSVDDLLRGNCLEPGAVLLPGQMVLVPPLPTATATPTATLIPTATRKPTFTPTWTPRPRRDNPVLPTATRRPVQPTEKPTEKPTDRPTNPPPPTPRPPDTPTPAPLP